MSIRGHQLVLFTNVSGPPWFLPHLSRVPRDPDIGGRFGIRGGWLLFAFSLTWHRPSA